MPCRLMLRPRPLRRRSTVSTAHDDHVIVTHMPSQVCVRSPARNRPPHSCRSSQKSTGTSPNHPEKMGRGPHQQRRRLHLQAVHRLHRRRLRSAGRRQPHGILLADAARHRRDAEAGQRPRRQHHDHPRRLRQLQHPVGADRTHQGRPRLGHQVTGHRVRLPRHPGQRRFAGHHPDAGGTRRNPTTRSPGSSPSGGWGRSATSSTASCSWSHRRSSPARSCTSTAARSPATDQGRAHPLGGSTSS
jgi:hypothetical protein